MSARKAASTKDRLSSGTLPLNGDPICIHDDDEQEPKPVNCKPIVSINGQDRKEEDEPKDRAA